MVGTWNLEVMTPFGKHPATLTFERNGDGSMRGRIASQMGNVPLSNITSDEQSFDADVSLDFQGRTFDARIAGQVANKQLDGTIKVNMPGAPMIRYTGTRAA
ncbi:MAG TPA: hypothetical protein VF666_03940 [Pyrinomonadaceae bacterium]|jgi:hypothetical protein